MGANTPAHHVEVRLVGSAYFIGRLKKSTSRPILCYRKPKEEGEEATEQKATGVAFAAVAAVHLQGRDIYVTHTHNT